MEVLDQQENVQPDMPDLQLAAQGIREVVIAMSLTKEEEQKLYNRGLDDYSHGRDTEAAKYYRDYWAAQNK